MKKQGLFILALACLCAAGLASQLWAAYSALRTTRMSRVS